MEVLGWLLIPLVGLLIGLAYAVWRSREPKVADAEQGMEELARFRQAMEKPLPSLDRARSSDATDDPTPSAPSDGPAR